MQSEWVQVPGCSPVHSSWISLRRSNWLSGSFRRKGMQLVNSTCIFNRIMLFFFLRFSVNLNVYLNLEFTSWNHGFTDFWLFCLTLAHFKCNPFYSFTQCSSEDDQWKGRSSRWRDCARMWSQRCTRSSHHLAVELGLRRPRTESDRHDGKSYSSHLGQWDGDSQRKVGDQGP